MRVDSLSNSYFITMVAPAATVEEGLEAIRSWAPPIIAALNSEYGSIGHEASIDHERGVLGDDTGALRAKQGIPPMVFLGGACNPTTWRRDIAMPYLDAHGISYYNPQVCRTAAYV